MSREVLGKRKRCILGLGVWPKPFSSSTTSSVASRAREDFQKLKAIMENMEMERVEERREREEKRRQHEEEKRQREEEKRQCEERKEEKRQREEEHEEEKRQREEERKEHQEFKTIMAKFLQGSTQNDNGGFKTMMEKLVS